MIKLLIRCIEKFTKETLLGRLEAAESSLRESRELTRVETYFSALNVFPCLSRSASTHGDFTSSSRTRSKEERNIEEDIAFLVRREPHDKKILKCWTCNEFGHYASKCPKGQKNYKRNFKPRKPRDYLYANEDDESKERVQSESDDELGFVAIKEDDLDKEIREEKALVSQVENNYNQIIDSGCSHHIAGDVIKFVKFINHDGCFVRFGKNMVCHITGIGSITLDGKTKTDDIYFVDGLKHNLLSVG